MEELKFVTSNPNKVEEVSDILGREVEQLDLDVDEIQSVELEEVVRSKADRAFESSGTPVMVEDTGLYIKGWNGFPGALIKWMLERLGREGICNALKGEDRSAVASTAVCIHDGEESRVFKGEIEGSIPREPRGESGFGWDPIFIPEGKDKSFAEMTEKEKNSISMRRKAVSKLKEFLEENPEFL
ncbi:MAG: RdgB/HAM1 family non-canonical purine NTP pyrophosphatase [Candidatus Nanohaloarchaea archaeon]|nr:RdgB/HAM1 family non-canonical purine NTP pyrophosphatase [Candidatus Nanohaloarchaea archaeon]